MDPMRTKQPRETPIERGDIPMEYRRGEFTMESKRMSPMQPRQRQKSCKYSSTSPYKMDRTVRIKATSSVATQTDLFQDPLEAELSEILHIDSFQDLSYLAADDNSEEFRKLVHTDSFQDPSQMVTSQNWKSIQIDSFQDHHSGLYRNSSEIDSFQDLCDSSLELTHFKILEHLYTALNIQIDSFQDPSNLHGGLPSGN